MRPKKIGLCLIAALGIMALAAGSAKATAGANWKVNGANISATLLPEIQTEGLEGKDVALLATVAGAALKVLCTDMKFENAVLKSEGSALGKIIFTGCKTFLNGVEQTKCVPKSSGAAAGTILTNLLKGLIILHSGAEGYVLLVPDAAGSDPEFVNFLLGATCAIGEEMPIYGVIVFKDCLNEGRVEKVTHLVEEFAALTVVRIFEPLATGTVATIDGSANVKLIGKDALGASVEGLKWSGIPA